MTRRRWTRAEFERARHLERLLSALAELPHQAPPLLERYWRLMERHPSAWHRDPLSVPLSQRLDEFKSGKDIPF